MALTYTQSGASDALTWGSAGTASVPNGSYKDVTDGSVSSGDLLIALAAGEGYTYSGGTRSIATQSGSTGAWATGYPTPTFNADTEIVTGWCTATGSGSVTVRPTVRTTSGAFGWIGSALIRIPAAEWSGTVAAVAAFQADADGQASVTLGAGTWTVIYIGADYSAGALAGSYTPASSTSRTAFLDGSHYGVVIRTWTGQAAGTRSYGPSGLSGRDFTGVIIAVPEASGGTGYTASPADTAGLTDGVTVVVEAARTAAESAGLTDSAAAVAGLSRAAGDAAGITDAASLGVGRNPVDTAGATDAAATAAAAARGVADGAGLADAWNGMLEVGAGSFDPVQGSDAVTTALEAARTAADPLGGSDAVTAALAAQRAAADAVGIGDVATVTQHLERTVADTLGAADAVSVEVVGDGEQSLSDTSGITETVTIALGASRIVVELVGVSDSVTIELSGAQVYEVTVHDGLGLTDPANTVVHGAEISTVYLMIPVPRRLTMTPQKHPSTMTRVEE